MTEKTLREALWNFSQSCFIGQPPSGKPKAFDRVASRLEAAESLTPVDVATWDATTQAEFAALCSEAIARLMLVPQYDPAGSAIGCTPQRLDAKAIGALLQLAAIVRAEDSDQSPA